MTLSKPVVVIHVQLMIQMLWLPLPPSSPQVFIGIVFMVHHGSFGDGICCGRDERDFVPVWRGTRWYGDSVTTVTFTVKTSVGVRDRMRDV